MSKLINLNNINNLYENNKLEIYGGVPLNGIVKIATAKNVFLPIIATLLITKDEVFLPLNNLIDVKTKLELLKCIGYEIIFNKDNINIKPSEKINNKLPFDLISNIRSSILFLGPLLALTGEVFLSFPGGDNLQRSFDFHIECLQKMGAIINIENNIIHAKLNNNKLQGTSYTFKKPSVGTTQHMILTGLLCEKDTITTLYNTSQEPECLYLIDILKNQFQGKIIKNGTTITIIGNGDRLLTNKIHNIQLIPDRIEALTYLSLGLITKGDVTIEGKNLLSYIGNNDLNLLTSIGGELIINENYIRIIGKNVNFKPIKYFESSEFPGVSTDFAPILCGILGLANGTSIFNETVHPSRFKYIEEINKFGGNFKINENNHLIITGNNKYNSCINSICTDIRGGMVLLMTALTCEGQSIIGNIFHIFRGYEKFIENINNLGGNIKIIS